MKFIVDARLPKRIATTFADLGHDVIHTRDLPLGNATSDQEILSLAGNDGIVISKDEDFYQSFLLQGIPPNWFWLKLEI